VSDTTKTIRVKKDRELREKKKSLGHDRERFRGQLSTSGIEEASKRKARLHPGKVSLKSFVSEDLAKGEGVAMHEVVTKSKHGEKPGT